MHACHHIVKLPQSRSCSHQVSSGTFFVDDHMVQAVAAQILYQVHSHVSLWGGGVCAAVRQATAAGPSWLTGTAAAFCGLCC